MADLLRIGASGISAYQRALQTTGHNISNANVDGYSRQETTFEARPGEFAGNGYVGTGINTTGVRRLTDDFLVTQLRRDNTAFTQLDSFLTNIAPIDSFLADSTTGLSSGFEKFFAAVAAGSDDPAFIPVRQLILNESKGLVERFQVMQDRLDAQNVAINEQLTTITAEINSLARGIADINTALNRLPGGNTGIGDQPNDLFDKRDKLLKDLSSLISFDTVFEDNGVVNISIGPGKTLVIGDRVSPITAKEGQTDLRLYDVGYELGGRFQVLNDSLRGGELGGLLEFRNSVLEPSINELGRIAMVLAETFNEQHRYGVDLEGNLGGDFFTDINDPLFAATRVIFDQENTPPDDRQIAITIEDVTQLSASDYTLEFKGPTNADFQIVRDSDGEVIVRDTLPNGFPVSYDFEGIELRFDAGSFQVGDRFLLQPTKLGARNLDVKLTRPQEIALGAPVKTATSLGNLGNGLISAGEILSIYQPDGSTLLDTFAVEGELTPPILIRFTTATTYDVLDNSDPNNPVDLVPPMRNRRFTAGQLNAVFSADPNQFSVQSNDVVGSPTTTVNLFPAVTNGYPAETLTVSFVDPDTQNVTSTSVSLAADESAEVSANKISLLPGVVAFADTEVKLSINDSATAPLLVNFNGVDLTTTSLGDVPLPLTADFLRDRINDNSALQDQGIFAISNGTDLTIRSVKGVDFNFDVSGGAAGDSLLIDEVNGVDVPDVDVFTGAGPATIGGTLIVELNNSGRLESDQANGRFLPNAVEVRSFKGYQVDLSGTPAAGDEFFMDYNGDGTADNRNARKLLELQTARNIDGGAVSFVGAYGRLVQNIGSITSQTRINQEASEALLRQSQQNRD